MCTILCILVCVSVDASLDCRVSCGQCGYSGTATGVLLVLPLAGHHKTSPQSPKVNMADTIDWCVVTICCPLSSFHGEPSPLQSTAAQRDQVVPGSLVVEPYSWRFIQASQPALRIATTGTTGATLTLPPG